MTKEEIIDIAREAGFKVAPFEGGKSKGEISVFDYGDVEIIKELTRFAKLVASKEREECAITAWSAGMDAHTKASSLADPREIGSICARAIRSRSKT